MIAACGESKGLVNSQKPSTFPFRIIFTPIFPRLRLEHQFRLAQLYQLKRHSLSPCSFCIPFVGITRHSCYICRGVPPISPHADAYGTMRCDAPPAITLVRRHPSTRQSSVRLKVEIRPGWHLRQRPAWCGEPRNRPRETSFVFPIRPLNPALIAPRLAGLSLPHLSRIPPL